MNIQEVRKNFESPLKKGGYRRGPFSIRRISPLYALRSWRIWRRNMRNFRKSAATFIPFPATPIMYTRHGTMPRRKIRKIHFAMLADPTGRLARDFDVMIEEDGVAERGDFIVNPQGEIVAYEVTAGNVGRNADEIFRRVPGVSVCRGAWRSGVPGKMEARRRDPETQPGSGGTDIRNL